MKTSNTAGPTGNPLTRARSTLGDLSGGIRDW